MVADDTVDMATEATDEEESSSEESSSSEFTGSEDQKEVKLKYYELKANVSFAETTFTFAVQQYQQ